MNNSVIIKSNNHGISVILDDQTDFSDIKEFVKEKFTDSSDFFGSVKMALAIEGRDLDEQQQKEIVDIIEECTDIKIICILDNDKQKDASFMAAMEKYMKNPVTPDGFCETAKSDSKGINVTDMSDGLFYKGTLRSGQVIEADTSIIVLGDVNPGGRIISKGNIIVLGSMRGNAFAGADGNENAFVVALDMNPMQIKIGGYIARCSDGETVKKKKLKKNNVTVQPKIAFVDDGNIYLEDLSADVLEDIKIN